MTGSVSSGGVEIIYTYTYGCKNTFQLALTGGSAPAPGQVTSNECTYTAAWAILGSGGDCSQQLGSDLCRGAPTVIPIS